MCIHESNIHVRLTDNVRLGLAVGSDIVFFNALVMPFSFPIVMGVNHHCRNDIQNRVFGALGVLNYINRIYKRREDQLITHYTT